MFWLLDMTLAWGYTQWLYGPGLGGLYGQIYAAQYW
jgi:hypothetical protein